MRFTCIRRVCMIWTPELWNFVRTYEVFSQSLLDVIGAIPSQGLVPLPLCESSVQGRRLANPPQPLEWLVVRRGGLLFHVGDLNSFLHEKRIYDNTPDFWWGINYFSRTSKASTTTSLTFGGGMNCCSHTCKTPAIKPMDFSVWFMLRGVDCYSCTYKEFATSPLIFYVGPRSCRLYPNFIVSMLIQKKQAFQKLTYLIHNWK